MALSTRAELEATARGRALLAIWEVMKAEQLQFGDAAVLLAAVVYEVAERSEDPEQVYILFMERLEILIGKTTDPGLAARVGELTKEKAP